MVQRAELLGPHNIFLEEREIDFPNRTDVFIGINTSENYAVLHSLRLGWRNLVRVSLIFVSVLCYLLCFLSFMYFISKNF